MQRARPQRQMERVVTRRNDQIRWLRKNGTPAAKGRCGRPNVRNHPNRAGELHALVVTAKQGGTAKRRSETARAVHHAANHGRIVLIRRGYGIDAENSDAKRPPFQGNRENVERVVIFNRLRELPQVGTQPLTVKFSYKHFGETGLGGRAATPAIRPFRGVMDGECSRVQVAFKLDSGLLNEALVFRVM